MPAKPMHELATRALALPESERLRLAQVLWESIEDENLPGYSEEELQHELNERLRDQPDPNWKSHAELMAEARRKFGCKK
jgi:putative addiction module component (TIGR02574 family)